MSEVRVDIFDIKTILVKQFPNALEVFSMKKSPRVLNELGNQIFSQINGAEFLGTWETLHNPNFKVVEFDHFEIHQKQGNNDKDTDTSNIRI